MITKTTDELRPGDVVDLYGFTRRTIASVTPGEVEGLLRVRYESIGTPFNGGHAEPGQEWQVDAPSKLDLAVQRAQELADQYANANPLAYQRMFVSKDFRELLDLFRAAR